MGPSRSASGHVERPGVVSAEADGDTDVTIDVPSGRVLARVRCRSGAVEGVTFRNVPSFVVRARRAGGRLLEVDVAYGGAIYALGACGAVRTARRARRPVRN